MTTVKKPAIDQTTTLPYRLALNIRALEMTEDQFLQLCSDNGDLRMELTANRELIIKPPNGLEGSSQELELARQVATGPSRMEPAAPLVRMPDTRSPTAQCAPPTLPGCPCHGGNR